MTNFHLHSMFPALPWSSVPYQWLACCSEVEGKMCSRFLSQISYPHSHVVRPLGRACWVTHSVSPQPILAGKVETHVSHRSEAPASIWASSTSSHRGWMFSTVPFYSYQWWTLNFIKATNMLLSTIIISSKKKNVNIKKDTHTHKR